MNEWIINEITNQPKNGELVVVYFKSYPTSIQVGNFHNNLFYPWTGYSMEFYEAHGNVADYKPFEFQPYAFCIIPNLPEEQP